MSNLAFWRTVTKRGRYYLLSMREYFSGLDKQLAAILVFKGTLIYTLDYVVFTGVFI
jgi:hypothetical protein